MQGTDIESFVGDIQSQVLDNYDTLVAITPRLIIAVVLLLIFWFLGYYVKKLANKRLEKNMNDSLLANFLAGLVRGVILLLGILFVLRFWGFTGVVTSVLTGAGISAFIIGFALKDIGENFLAGILLAFKRPFKIGDVIEITGMKGRVIKLNLRDTQIKTEDGKDVYMPNGSIVKNPLINFTIDGFIRNQFDIGLDHGSDYPAAILLMEKSMLQVKGVLKGERAPMVVVKEITNNAIIVTTFYWVNTFTRVPGYNRVKSQAIVEVVQALEKAGFNLKR
ncbi:mechanosensitive ion channel family protein [Anditalea andensis]|uniref:mechanosensitive ion channel family protein n=1 Tax=Anditalea andensis TaxID=1048983 RepID=UPI00068B0990|nr:mechanosensitive ion channel family protein [Anditalea andensis]